MTTHTDFLTNLRVASPCHVGWDHMSGNERVRFCDSCELNVYNLSEMSAPEIESLIVKSNGRICGRMYRRADGTVITRDCPVGLRAVRRKVSRLIGSVFATIISVCSVTFCQSKQDASKPVQKTAFKVERTLADRTKIGTLSGSVTDSIGAVVVGAPVVLKQLQTNKEVIAKTDESGTFSFSGLTDGLYEITVTVGGFSPFKVTDIQIMSTEGYRAEIALGIAEIVGLLMGFEPIESTGGTMILQPNTIKKLPINNRP